MPPSRTTALRGSARRERKELILGVGCRAFVHCCNPAETVPLLDDGGHPLAHDLADGQEIEVVAWRPRSRGGLAYQIRRLSDGWECWILAVHLRRGRTPEPEAKETVAVAAEAAPQRRTP